MVYRCRIIIHVSIAAILVLLFVAVAVTVCDWAGLPLSVFIKKPFHNMRSVSAVAARLAEHEGVIDGV